MTVKVTNMTCNHCVRTITMALMKEKIVAEINLSDQTVTVNHPVDEEKVKAVIQDAGYDVQ
mgnify:CR=1 FL=1